MRPKPGVLHAARRKRAPADSADASPRRSRPSVIGDTLVMKGELFVGEEVIIEGTFDGTLTGQGDDAVTLRRSATLSGEISASDVRIENGTNLRDTILSGRISPAED